MDYKDLADLIFPDVKEISYYEEKYPKRNLPEGAEVLRVAPSPTGNVHIGTIYQALICTKITRQTKGVFYARIEDTDQKREIEGGTIQIIDSLENFDLSPNEGMINEEEWEGEYGPYKQSMRKDIYQAYAKYLLSQGKAYPCFASPEELDEMRKKQEAAKIRTGYYGVWAKYRNLSVEEAAEKIKAGEPYIIRFKSPGREDYKIKHKDIIKGNVEFPENDQDIVIIKADGLPTYHFAHAVDDHLMGTTIVTRGDEWLASVPLHLQLFQELGFKTLKYAHTPTLLKSDDGNKRKISKRKDPEAAATYYDEVGIPSLAVKEYLLNIGNSSFENWRRQNPNASLDDFNFELNKMSVSGALFDMVKLLDVSKIVISRYSAEEVYDYGFRWAKNHDEELLEFLNDKEYSLKVLGIERGNAKPRKDIAKWSDLKENIIYMYKAPEEYEFDKISGEKAKEVVKEYINIYDENDDKETWFNKMKDVAEKLGYAREVKLFKENPDKYEAHVGDISTVIRVAITGRRNTPDLYEILKVLGKEEVLNRLNKVM